MYQHSILGAMFNVRLINTLADDFESYKSRSKIAGYSWPIITPMFARLHAEWFALSSEPKGQGAKPKYNIHKDRGKCTGKKSAPCGACDSGGLLA